MPVPPSGRISGEHLYPPEDLPRNRESLDPYFGEFLALLRRSISPGGSEFGLGVSLFSLAVSINAAFIIEVGRFKGFSTLALASALKLLSIGWSEPQQHKQRPDIDYPKFESPPERILVSIDPVPTPEAAALIEQAGLQKYVKFADAFSSQVRFNSQADLILIDGDHRYEGCLADVEALIPNHLRPGGYFILHDYFGWYDEHGKNNSPIKRVVEKLIADGRLEHLLLDTGYMSFVIFRKPNPATET